MVGVDAAGGIILGGTLTGTLNLGGGQLSSAGGEDVAVARLDGAGNHLWSKRFGDGGDQNLGSIATDGQNQVVAVGTFSGDLGLGATLAGAPFGSAFIASFDMLGNLAWRKGVVDSGKSSARGVTVALGGAPVVTGGFSGNPDFGGGPVLPAPGGNGVFVASFGSSGVHIWSKGYACASQDGCSGNAVAIAPASGLVVTGWYFGGIDLGGGMLPDSVSSNVFVAKIGPGGAHLWSQGFVTQEDSSSGNGIAVDASGNVIVTGGSPTPIDFGGGMLSGGAFIVKFDPAGNHVWSKTFGAAPSTAVGNGIALDAAGDIVVTGSFSGTVNFGGGPLTAAGGQDVFVLKLDPQGNHLWSRRFGDSQAQRGTSVAFATAKEIVVTGNFSGLVDFGGGMLPSQSPDDLFLARYLTP
ncbi:MAG: hypothetical protein QM820_31485 [Minicystis sp.]